MARSQPGGSKPGGSGSGPEEGVSSGESTWRSWGEAAGLVLRGATVSVAVPVSAVVGTVLSAVNQGDVLVSGEAGAAR